MSEWMCPLPARCIAVSIDARVGGELRLEIEENGVSFAVWGRFLALDAPRLIRFTWSCSTWPDPSVESVVTVTFDPVGEDRTDMTIEHSLLPPDLVDRHEEGWRAIAAQLHEELGG